MKVELMKLNVVDDEVDVQTPNSILGRVMEAQVIQREGLVLAVLGFLGARD